MIDIAFIHQCAPYLAPATVNSIAKTESSFNPWAIGVNSGNRLKRQPTNYRQAVQIANELMKKGASFDVGLGQINSLNFNGLGLSIEQVFDPCTNLKAMETILMDCWNRAKKIEPDSSKSMLMAYSCYNTGNHRDGFRNGYVNKVVNSHKSVTRALGGDSRLFLTGLQARSTNTPKVVIQPVYAQNLPTNKEDLANYVNYAQVKPSSNDEVSNVVASADDAINLVNNVEKLPVQVKGSELTKNDDPAVRVHHSWDIFQDF